MFCLRCTCACKSPSAVASARPRDGGADGSRAPPSSVCCCRVAYTASEGCFRKSLRFDRAETDVDNGGRCVGHDLPDCSACPLSVAPEPSCAVAQRSSLPRPVCKHQAPIGRGLCLLPLWRGPPFFCPVPALQAERKRPAPRPGVSSYSKHALQTVARAREGRGAAQRRTRPARTARLVGITCEKTVSRSHTQI
jgi:hypothetical protein